MVVNNSTLDPDGIITVSTETVASCMDRRSLLYDKNGEAGVTMTRAIRVMKPR